MNTTTQHKIYNHDSTNLSFLDKESVHLVVTSPYFNIKEYPSNSGQLGNIDDYEKFNDELTKVWKECLRVLVPGGRLVVIVGDILLSRKKYGRHRVLPLHSSIQLSCEKIGFDNLSPIIWHKISNVSHEIERGSGFLGKPYEPNAIIKNDIEYILMLRKPGGYRSPTEEQREYSKIPKEDFRKFFSQIWTDVPGAKVKGHLAPFPQELAERLISMFSFIGDTVLDPFVGTGSTIMAVMQKGRNSIGVDIEKTYVELTMNRIQKKLSICFKKQKKNAFTQ